MRKTLLLSTALTVIAIPGVHSAPPIVHDPINLVENAAAAVQAATQTAQQAQQIANEIQMLVNQAQNLQQIPDSILADYNAAIMDLENLLASTRGLIETYSSVDQGFQTIYNPDEIGYDVATTDDFEAEREVWAEQTIRAVNDAMVAQDIEPSVNADSLTLENLVVNSESSVGALQAMQAGNQIAALMTTQLLRMQTIIAQSERAKASQIAAMTQEERQDRANEVRQFSGLGNRTTLSPPKSFNSYINAVGPSLGSAPAPNNAFGVPK